ncbi:MAG: lamin tail domain-containing protein [candidate division WOR-3 bacterium]|nr:MAG: lamin tail domain-containing protein [candidate division WOR-3 bacterium]
MNPALLTIAILLINQTPLLNESFTGTTFPPPGWDTLRSDTTMGDWYRYYYTGPSGPDSYQARVRVYSYLDTLRTGWTSLKTFNINLNDASGQESLFFWYRFSQDTGNLGPDDTMYIDISNDDYTWMNLLKIGQGADTNVWTTARIPLIDYDTYDNARIRFHYEDQPNGYLGSFNCNFWLDSVQVKNYDTIPETIVLNELLVKPETFDHNSNNNFQDSDEEYVEIYNKTENQVSVGGYSIVDAAGNDTLTIPMGYTIPDSGFLLLYASGEFLIADRNGITTVTGNWLGSWTTLDDDTDTLYLLDALNNELDEKAYTSTDVFPDCAVARIPDGNFNWMGNALATPGQTNGDQYVWPLAYAFQDLDSNYVPDNIGTAVTITGLITAPPGVFSNSEAYLQDYTGGVCLYGDFPVALDYGDSITAAGIVDQYRGKNEITSFTYSLIMQNATIPEPIDVNGHIMNTELYEGSLVRIKVGYFSGLLLEGNEEYYAWDTLNAQFTVWIDSYTDIPGSIAPTDTFTLTGIKGQYTTATPPDNGYQLMPRSVTDFSHLYTPTIIEIGEVQKPGPDSVTSKYVDSIVTVEGVITGPNYVFTTGNPSFYIQDNTGGINIYNVDGDTLFNRWIDSVGARVQITGTVTEYRGLTEIANGYGSFIAIDTVPSARQILPNWLLTEGMESFLVEMTGVVASTPYQTGDGFNFDFLNGDAGIAVRFTTASGINPATVVTNTRRHLTGIVGQYDPEAPYNTGYQLLLRFPQDIAEPGYDTVSSAPLLELVTTKTFLPAAGEQAQIKINSPYDYRLELDIHDMSGRMVRRLYSGAGGPNVIYWDGKDDLARPCKIGIYLMNLKAINSDGKSSFVRSLIVIGSQ